MPKLFSEAEDLTCNIWYNNVKGGWYYYGIKLHWKGRPVINPDVRFPDDDGNPQDSFRFCYHEGDGLRQIFDYTLKTGFPRAWDSVEPDISLAIYPGGCWPYTMDLKENSLNVLKGSAYQLKKQRRSEAFKSDGIWTCMFFVDTECLIEGDFMSGDGIIMSLSTTRKEVERFRKELEEEHKELIKRLET